MRLAKKNKTRESPLDQGPFEGSAHSGFEDKRGRNKELRAATSPCKPSEESCVVGPALLSF